MLGFDQVVVRRPIFSLSETDGNGSCVWLREQLSETFVKVRPELLSGAVVTSFQPNKKNHLSPLTWMCSHSFKQKAAWVKGAAHQRNTGEEASRLQRTLHDEIAQRHAAVKELADVLAGSSSLGVYKHTTDLRTAAACAILHKIAVAHRSRSPVLAKATAHVIDSVYLPEDEEDVLLQQAFFTKLRSPEDPGPNKASAPPSSFLKGSDASGSYLEGRLFQSARPDAEGTFMVSQFAVRTPWAVCFKESSQRWASFERQIDCLHNALACRPKVLSNAVTAWQRCIAGRLLVAWRVSSARRKANSRGVRDLIVSARRLKTLQKVLWAWLQVTVRQNLHRVAGQLLEHQKSLEDQKAKLVEVKTGHLRKTKSMVSEWLTAKEVAEDESGTSATLSAFCHTWHRAIQDWKLISQHVILYLASLTTPEEPTRSSTPPAPAGQTPAAVRAGNASHLHAWYETTHATLLRWVNQKLLLQQQQQQHATAPGSTTSGGAAAVRGGAGRKQVGQGGDDRPKQAGGVAVVTNFTSDWRTGEALAALVAAVTGKERPAAGGGRAAGTAAETVQSAVTDLKLLGLDVSCQPDSWTQGHPDVIVAVLAALWHHDEDPAPDATPADPPSPSLSPFPTPTPPSRSIPGVLAREDAPEKVKASVSLLNEAEVELSRWQSTVLQVDGYAMHLAACRAQGRPVKLYSKQEEQESVREYKVYFEGLRPDQLPELFVSGGVSRVAKEQERRDAEELRELLGVLAGYFAHVKRIFCHYANAPQTEAWGGDAASGKRPVVPTVDFAQFWRFCVECQLVDHAFKKGHAAALFADVNLRCRAEPASANNNNNNNGNNNNNSNNTANTMNSSTEAFNPDHLLVPVEFVQLLLRIAVLRFGTPVFSSAQGQAKVTHEFAIGVLFEEYLIPKAGMAVHGLDFKVQCWSEPVQAVVKKQRPKLLRLFRAYATERSNITIAGHCPHTLAFTDLCQMLKDAGLMPRRVSADELTELFAAMQTDNPEDDSDTLVFSEFEECVACLATFLNPSPFEPLANKVQQFIDTVLNQIFLKPARKADVKNKR
ncbi:Fimbrin [Diplonema papillatum]|nr:Fimbrin [Diplonema papillatum]